MKTTTHPVNHLKLLSLAALALAATPVAGLAQSSTWNTTVTPSAWNVAGNWVGNVIADGSGNTADFSQLDITADTTVNLTVNRTIGNLIFGDTATGTAGTWVLAGGGGVLTLAGAAPTITVNSLGTGKFVNATAVLAGTSGFTKNGSGMLILNNAGNTISGAVTLSAGILQLNTAGLTNATSVAINGGLLVVATSSANAIGGTISFGGGMLQYNSVPLTDYSSQFSTASNQIYNINTGVSGSTTFSSVLSSSGGTLTKTGTGTLTLAAANTFSGATAVSAGNLTLSNALALQNSAIDATNSVTGSATQGFILSGVTTPTFGGLTGTKNLSTLFNTSTGGYGSVTSLTLNPGTGANYSYSGVIADGAAGMSLTKTGAGTQALSGNNSYTGGTAINAGTLALGSANAIGTTGTISFGGGTLKAFNTTDYSSRFSTAASQAYNIDTNAQSITWATALTSAGGSLTKSGAGTLALTGGVSNTFSGPIAVNGGRLSVTDGTSLKNVTGAITVASGAAFYFGQNFTANNLTNALTLSGTGDGTYGALNLGFNAVATGGITLAADTTITHDWNNATIQGGAITGTGRNLQLTTTEASQPGLVISSAIQTGSGSVSVTSVANIGGYGVRLGGDNTFTGGLTINNGVVQLNSAGALNSTAGSENAVTFGASTTTGKLALNGRSFVIANLTSNATPGSPVVENGNATAVTLTVGNSQNLSGTFAGVIQNGTGGALALNKAGTGALTFSGVNTYTGATTVSAGTLILSSTGSIASSQIGFVVANATSGLLTAQNTSFSFSGTLSLDLASVSVSSGSWTLFDGSAFGAGDLNLSALTNNLAGLTFSNPGSLGIWSGTDLTSRTWTFTEDSGQLSVVPEPSTWALLAFALTAVATLRRRRLAA